MATTNTTTDLAIKPQVLDYAVVEVHKIEKKEDGTESKEVVFTAITGKDAITKAEEAGRVKFKQTVSWDDAGSDEGIAQVIKNEKDRVAVFNAGLKSSRINPRVKRLLEEVDENNNLQFEPVQGSYDIRALLNEPAQRRSLSDTEKAVAALMPLFPHMTETQLLQMLDVMKASGASLPGIDLGSDAEGEEEEVTA